MSILGKILAVGVDGNSVNTDSRREIIRKIILL